MNAHRSLRTLVFALLALAVALTAFASVSSAWAQASNTEVRRIANKLQCPVCQGTSVADSPSPVAQGMRDRIRDLLAEGRSEREILDYFRSVYGDFILRQPPTTGFAGVIWWVPGLVIVAAGGMLYVFGWRRRPKGPVAEASLAPLPALSGSEAELYRQRLQRLLEE